MQDHVRELAMKNSELETKLAAMKHEKKKLEAKLKRAEAAMLKLRMEVADVLQSEYEPTITQKALLKEAMGNGYGAQESGKRLLRLHAAEIVEHIRRKAGHDNTLKQMELGGGSIELPIGSRMCDSHKPTNQRPFQAPWVLPGLARHLPCLLGPITRPSSPPKGTKNSTFQCKTRLFLLGSEGNEQDPAQ